MASKAAASAPLTIHATDERRMGMAITCDIRALLLADLMMVWPRMLGG
jgi:hypothetical protein